MEFCECGSLKIGGSCTNKKCPKHIKKNEKISDKQLSIIEQLLERLDKDYNESTYKKISTDDAQSLIEDLKEELEELKNRKLSSEENGLEEETTELIELDEEDTE